MLICRMWGCRCTETLDKVEELNKEFRGVMRSIQVWMLARGDLQENDAKMLFSLRTQTAVGLDSGDVGDDRSWPHLEHA